MIYKNYETYQAIFTPLIIGMIVGVGLYGEKGIESWNRRICREASTIEDMQADAALSGPWRLACDSMRLNIERMSHS